ncbi:MAG: hypothetical protein ACO3N7_00390 [Kiritimatiellia bacterium]
MRISPDALSGLHESLNRFTVWICLGVLLCAPFVIHTFHYEPNDDGKRHVAKAISGKAWPEILVMNERFQDQDHNEGWHKVLRMVYLTTDLPKEDLLLLSTITLFLGFMLSGFFMFRAHPEWWISSVFLSIFYVSPGRWLLARPFILSSTALLILLHLWKRETRCTAGRIGVSVLLIALASWMHGAWYLFGLFPLSLALTGRLKASLQTGGCWILGSLLAGILVGNPAKFMILQVLQSLESTGNTPLTRLLVTEFQPLLQFVPLFVLTLGAAAAASQGKSKELCLSHPAFWLSICGYVLGIQNGRFWTDWGSVGMLYWVADCGCRLQSGSGMPLRLKGIACVALYLGLTVDFDSRWSNNDRIESLQWENPEHRKGLPDPGGIFYSDSMGLFYDTFYNNPQADWKYILGFEPALMPAEDLETYRTIQFYGHRDDDLYFPWVRKMTPADRLVLQRSKGNPPRIPELHWDYIAYNVWSGRVPEIPDPFSD